MIYCEVVELRSLMISCLLKTQESWWSGSSPSVKVEDLREQLYKCQSKSQFVRNKDCWCPRAGEDEFHSKKHQIYGFSAFLFLLYRPLVDFMVSNQIGKKQSLPRLQIRRQISSRNTLTSMHRNNIFPAILVSFYLKLADSLD